MAADWYKRTPRDFIDGIIGLSIEEIGAYSVILDLIYLHNSPIRHDTKWLSGLFRCSTRKAGALVESLVAAGKLTLENGRIGNRRASAEMQVRAVSDQVHAKNGKKGGELASENRRRAKENNGLGLPPKVPDKIREEENRAIPDRAESRGPAKPEAVDDGDAVPQEPDAAPVKPLTRTEKIVGEIMKMAAMTAPNEVQLVAEWLRQGATWKRHIKPVVEQMVASSGGPIRSMRYFHSKIMAALASDAAEEAAEQRRIAAVERVRQEDAEARERDRQRNEEIRRIQEEDPGGVLDEIEKYRAKAAGMTGS